MWYEKFLERGLIPDSLLRVILRIHNRIRFQREEKDIEKRQEYINGFIRELKQQPISINVDQANEQHYELPTEFFQIILGEYMKYSCGIWNENNSDDLTQSEMDMLKLSCKRAQVYDGDIVIDLGCGWGSLSFYLAENYNLSKIVAVSNSATQKRYIEEKANANRITNLEVIKADIKEFATEEKFDKILSIEMFEHMRNYEQLFEKLYNFLKPKGKLFIHIFTDLNYPYFFELDNPRAFMAKYFFRGGIMPSADLLFYFAKKFSIENVWRVNGTHYKKTLDTWLKRMKQNKNKIVPLFKATYGKENAKKWWNYWKTFFIGCAEAFGSKKGQKRFVSHYLFQKEL